jgi:hypothetical protein
MYRAHQQARFWNSLQEKDQPVSVISTWFSRIKASIKAHKWIWAASSAAVLVGIVAAILYFTGVFGPSGRAVCKVTVDRAKAYGTLSPSAEQDGSAKSTNIAGRKTCLATDGADKYVITVEIKCKDLKNDDCLPIYSVEREDGLSLYQVRAVPNDLEEADSASIPPPPNQGTSEATGGSDGGSADVTDVEVAHPGAASTADGPAQ